MPKLLRINSSSRFHGSYTNSIADHATSLWRTANPGAEIITRNVADGSIPLITQQTIEGFYATNDTMTDELLQAIALSDQLIAELKSADLLLICAPIYNFSVPAALKTWIDQIVRVGHTFSYEDGEFKGLITNTRAIVINAYGAEGYLNGEPFSGANFLQPYLEFLLPFLGIEDTRFVALQGTTGDPVTIASNVSAAKAEITKLMV